MLSIVRRGEHRYDIFENDRDIGSVSVSRSPLHARHCQLHLELERLYDRFLTARGAELARERRKIAAVYYEALWREVTEGRAVGRKLLEESITAE